jgi:carbonic anhydrase/acetyltransferase-like protein (isoleucine patch superfamily)
MMEKFKNFSPQAAASAFVHERAVVIGRVKLGEKASVWPNAVVRADIGAIEIGDNTNVQDGCVIHVDRDKPCIVGKDVTIGHGAVLHSCKIGNRSLIGMKAVVMDSVIGDECIIGAGSVVPPGKTIPPRSMVMGVPARIIRNLTEAEVEALGAANRAYLDLLPEYKGK